MILVLRVTIYGYILPHPDPIRGKGSGSLVDLVYFLDPSAFGNVSADTIISQIHSAVSAAGFRIVGRHVDNKRTNPLEKDRITVENWDQHIKMGVEDVGEIRMQDDTYSETEGMLPRDASQFMGRYF